MPAVDPANLLFIVTGTHLTAELGDRPLAYRIEAASRPILARLLPTPPGARPRLSPAVVSDAWFVNNDDVQDNPVISVGGPGVNALSALLYEKLPSALAIENTLLIQLDLDGEDPRAAVWGMTHLDTIHAVDLFLSRGYLETFLTDAAARAEDDDI
jgi:hypothetical protein